MALILNTGQNSYKSDLEGLFETLQEQRSELLSMVRDVQLAARLLAVAEARRLSELAGDDPRVAHYLNSSDTILRRAAALEIESEIANIRVPPITKSETLLQGRITDESARATAHVAVTLVDEKGAPVVGVASVETDDSGYFAFILQPAQVDAIGAGRKLTLQVGRASGKLVPVAAQAFTLASGEVKVSETRLQPSELEKLRLRPVQR
ncbi:MAG: carboxypeptidase-like regulatory domain-containing protein [Candidatus Accumulibacter phosphatis]|uniref:Carboxypeptidase regulatory-like domain-containing protein n=1 Tax=Candidatus Accumulibacter phosphatis TaxID=327160 RepID=A0A5S4EJ13_9PROT|nr:MULTISPECIES: carboxypeptidase-like regulatory domain-containing protein [Candidatus Accumulibacter]MBL8400326.1 carboxypeptidase regulatory-like domain-containing protein [Accumulibacter sp.]MBN8518963.1 carboxypeptidase regulatory-like domain-containing protein [Accumulibacter sp.]MBO3709164.1 carboxypeptidase regulatory-like domain-containing protein [Accumulibacter sp.]MCM8578093.1 carboxypeptidase-like regulatory domain-containing protein [Accumulibacter sp.]MCM8621286.1 carboxypeptida